LDAEIEVNAVEVGEERATDNGFAPETVRDNGADVAVGVITRVPSVCGPAAVALPVLTVTVSKPLLVISAPPKVSNAVTFPRLLIASESVIPVPVEVRVNVLFATPASFDVAPEEVLPALRVNAVAAD